MSDYEYYQPTSLQEALAIKADRGGDARFVAGGTDVHVLRRAGLLNFNALISLRRAPELDVLEERGGVIRLGAGLTLTKILDSDLIREALPGLYEAVESMGCTQMRNLATLGGNVMNAVSSGDAIPPLLCLDAVCVLVSNQGERKTPLAEMFTGPRTTAAREDEILLRLEAPRPGPTSGGAFAKLGRRAALDLAVVNLAVRVELAAEGRTMEKVRVAAGAVGPTPLRLRQTEAVMQGRAPTTELLEQAAQAALDETRPWDDVRASRWYRREMIKVMLPRTAAKALSRAGVEVQP